jgi:hypothetical protein
MQAVSANMLAREGREILKDCSASGMLLVWTENAHMLGAPFVDVGIVERATNRWTGVSTRPERYRRRYRLNPQT